VGTRADRQLQSLILREANRLSHIRSGGAACDHRRMVINVGIPHLAGLLVLKVIRR